MFHFLRYNILTRKAGRKLPSIDYRQLSFDLNGYYLQSPLYVLLKRNKYTYNRAGSGSVTGNVLISTVVYGEKITHHFHITSN